MKLLVPYVLVSIAVFGATAFGQNGGYGTDTDTDNSTDTDVGTDMGVSPTSTAAYGYQPTPAGMMPGYMSGGILPMNVGGSSSQSQPPTNTVQSLIARLVSFFDLSHVSSDTTSTPVTFDMVYDPATGKFTHLTTDVEQSGGAYYVPVCPVDVITGAASAQGCDYGIRLNPVPLNVAQAHLSTVHTLFSIVRNLARPSFMFGGLNAMDYAQ